MKQRIIIIFLVFLLSGFSGYSQTQSKIILKCGCSKSKPPLVLVGMKKKHFEIPFHQIDSFINSSMIKSLKIIEPSKSFAYGAKGANGVLLIGMDSKAMPNADYRKLRKKLRSNAIKWEDLSTANI